MYTLKEASVCKVLRAKLSTAISMMAIAQLQASLGRGLSWGCKNMKCMHTGCSDIYWHVWQIRYPRLKALIQNGAKKFLRAKDHYGNVRSLAGGTRLRIRAWMVGRKGVRRRCWGGAALVSRAVNQEHSVITLLSPQTPWACGKLQSTRYTRMASAIGANTFVDSWTLEECFLTDLR